MSQIRGKLKTVRDGDNISAMFWCPGCNAPHMVKVQGAGSWGFNGNSDAPTFTPSVLVQSGHYMLGHADNVCWCDYNAKRPGQEKSFECKACHSFVTDGRIQFCQDSTHALAGQTVPIPDWAATMIEDES